MLPAVALAHDNLHAPKTRRAAPARVERVEHVQRYAPPRVEHVRRYAPARVEHVRRYAPAHMEHAQRYAPARVEHVQRYAPARVEHVQHIQRYAAPVRRERVIVPAPFVRRVAPERSTRRTRVTTTSPFVQYVRTAPRVRRETIRRTVVASPLVRSVYASRVHAIPVVYHPRYVAGRVVRRSRNEVVIEPPAGTPIVVRDVVVGSSAPIIPVGSYVSLPVTYANGYYTYAQPAYSGYNYDYGYAPQYDYAYAPAMYCNGNSSTALYAALLPAVVGMLTGNGSSFNSNDLASVALQAAAGGNSCVAAPPSYAYSAPAYSAPVSYSASVPVTYAVTQAVPYYAPSTYATPYDTCLAGDEDGDETCAPANGYAYNTFSSYGAYAPQQVQGVVIGRSGDMLMVLGASGTPTFVYAAPALQSGFAANGPVQPGQIIDAYGYYSGNTFVATALV
jgi:hypothetical protein